jgi:glycine cleavage system regulatory protein
LYNFLPKTFSSIPRYFSTAEKEYLILNTVGPDRVGIVSSITKLVVEKGGNVGESQASKLGSHFGLMMLVSVPKDRSQDLIQSVKGIEGMNTSCFVTDDPTAVTASPKVGCEYTMLHVSVVLWYHVSYCT